MRGLVNSCQLPVARQDLVPKLRLGTHCREAPLRRVAPCERSVMKRFNLLACLSVAGLLTAAPVMAQTPAVLTQEKERAAVVAKIKPSVVAVFARGGQGGGTGVLISDDGFALTNFHVVQPTGPTMQCGLPDGVLYDAVLVGLDKVGDVALIKLLPKKDGQKFPA